MNLVVLHVVIGFFVYLLKPLAKVYFVGVVGYFLWKILSVSYTKKTYYILIASAYVVGVEVLFRMTKASFSYEFSKYFVTLIMFYGLIVKGISKKSLSYIFYLLLLVPSILIATKTLGYELNFRTSVLFALSGPICLGLCALFCYDRRVTRKQLLQVLAYLSYPIISMTAYLYFYTPSVKEVLSGTASNFETSGGFGPNQVATVLGLGMFALTVRFFKQSPSLFLKILNLFLLAVISYRAIVTFSRGGVITAILMVVAFLVIYFFRARLQEKSKIIISFLLLFLIAISTWVYSSSQTYGLIEKRYANEDASGKEKKDVSTGRLELFVEEMEGFFNNPFFGVGASGMKQYRFEKVGKHIASHNEVSRLFAEHGMLGIFMLLLLLIVPLTLRTNNKKNQYFYAFLVFWFATINHSSMRIAAPAFIYALALLNVTHEKRPLHRKQLKKPAV